MNTEFAQTAEFIASHPWLIAAVVLWTLPWKGVALWRAAKNQQMGWFVALLVVNTLGILEITYIFYFSRPRDKSAVPPVSNQDKNLVK